MTSTRIGRTGDSPLMGASRDSSDGRAPRAPSPNSIVSRRLRDRVARMLGEILDELLTSRTTGPCITATRRFPARPAVPAPFPASLDGRLAEALRARGIAQLYSHQGRCWEL